MCKMGVAGRSCLRCFFFFESVGVEGDERRVCSEEKYMYKNKKNIEKYRKKGTKKTRHTKKVDEVIA